MSKERWVKADDARRRIELVEIAFWIVSLLVLAGATLLLRACGPEESGTPSTAFSEHIGREWEMIFGGPQAPVVLAASIQRGRSTHASRLEILLEHREGAFRFNGEFLADGTAIAAEKVPLSTFYAVSIEEMRRLISSRSLCLDPEENVCLSDESRRISESVLKSLP